MDEGLLSRIEDAGINASAPPQQLWLDGWLLRFSPGKAKRARCINAVASGRLPLAQKLKLAGAVFRQAALPMMVRMTPFTRPSSLDLELEQRGFTVLEDTQVMVCSRLPHAATAPRALPAGTHWAQLNAADFAEAVGALRGSPEAQRRAHAERLQSSPVQYLGYALRRDADGLVLACGQYAVEAELIGLYDVFIRESERWQGLGQTLCEHLLFLAVLQGAEMAYLQVDGNNHSARHIYQKLGFADAYAYHYRQAPEAWATS